jgi:hypothetical protein
VEVSYGTFNIYLQAQFAAATMTNINNEMLALITKHHTLDQQQCAKDVNHCAYQYHSKNKRKISYSTD